VKAKVAAGKAWVKGKVEAGKAWAKGKFTPKPQARGRESVDHDLTSAAGAADAVLSRPGIDRTTIGSELPGIKTKYGLSSAGLVTESDGRVYVTVQKSSKKTPSHIIQEKLTTAKIHAMIRTIANSGQSP